MIEQYLKNKMTLPLNGLSMSIDAELKKWQKMKDPDDRRRAAVQIEAMIANLYQQIEEKKKASR